MAAFSPGLKLKSTAREHSGLATAAILSKENLSIDLYASDKKNKNIYSRTTAISDSNYLYIKNILNLVESKLFLSCKKIDLFFE
jgi:hypothetical protein